MLQSDVFSITKTLPMATKQRRGIQSVELASKLLEALALHMTPMSLGDVAKAGGMTAGKAHPYMVSFTNVGFVSQDGVSGKYELGPLALQLGLAKLRQLNPMKEAAPLVAELSTSTEQSVAVAIWGNMGPTIVQLVEPVQPLHVNLRTGTVMSLTGTATGRLFAAYLPPKAVETLLKSNIGQLGAGSNPTITPKQFDANLAEIREHGMSRTIGQPIPGINAFSAPVFDAAGNIVLAITIMGSAGAFDESWDGKIARLLKKCAAEISQNLGSAPSKAA
jgi:DNA-binding IclR family transcriptional regulator